MALSTLNTPLTPAAEEGETWILLSTPVDKPGPGKRAVYVGVVGFKGYTRVDFRRFNFVSTFNLIDRNS